jgi:hypothetical protein
MRLLVEYFEIIVVMLFIVMFLMLFIIIGYNRFFSKYYSSKKFQVLTQYEIEAVSGHKVFSIHIYNKNLNDTRVTALGYTYKNQNIDYYKNYLKNQQMPVDARVLIPSRDFIVCKIDVEHLKNIIWDINHGKRRVRKLSVYVTDSLGLTTKVKAKQIKKQIKKQISQDILDKKETIKMQKEKEKQDDLYKKKLVKNERTQKRNESFARVRFNLKNKIRKIFRKK